MLENGLPKQINITGWASPEGEETHNAGVSKNRAEVATAQLRQVLDEVLTIMAKRANIKPQDVEYYKYNQLKQIIITTRAAGEDWVHFVVMVEESDIQDKHAIINVVETQQNLIKREQMIKNMATVYGELNSEIFPNLRRAQIALYYSEARKSDPELAKQASLNPAKLSFDELDDSRGFCSLYGKTADELSDEVGPDVCFEEPWPEEDLPFLCESAAADACCASADGCASVTVRSVLRTRWWKCDASQCPR